MAKLKDKFLVEHMKNLVRVAVSLGEVHATR
jgi:hypothetical protein